MNVVVTHAQMVRDVFLNVELLLNSGIRELSEYDIQGMMFLAFRTALTNTPWRADRETSGKVDCVVFEAAKPLLLYEIKTYFKPRERLRLEDFRNDLQKLRTTKAKYPDARAFFLVAAGKTKIKQASVRADPVLGGLVSQEDRKWTVLQLKDGSKLSLRPSRREHYGRSVVLTWEVK